MKIFYIALVALISLLGGCSSNSEKPKVLVTIAPYKLFVEEITEGAVDVELVVPKNFNPHFFESTPRSIANLEGANIWFGIGEPFEKSLYKSLKQSSKDLQYVNLSETISITPIESSCCHHHHHETMDLHIWMDPLLVIEQVEVMTKTLIARFPEFEPTFLERSDALKKRLKALDNTLDKQLQPLSGDAIVVSHPAFGYFCKRYDLLQISLEQEGKAPLLKEVMQTLEEMKKQHVRCALSQPQYNNQAVELVAKKLNIPIYSVNPYDENYFEMMTKLGNDIVGIHD